MQKKKKKKKKKISCLGRDTVLKMPREFANLEWLQRYIIGNHEVLTIARVAEIVVLRLLRFLRSYENHA